ncbi:hypothetical protein [Acinetobacter sp.]|uniref:hypothetical protein n=1 Tax=Acinetobacter sp. TaxID=472 RepID=UPI002FDB6D39
MTAYLYFDNNFVSRNGRTEEGHFRVCWNPKPVGQPSFILPPYSKANKFNTLPFPYIDTCQLTDYPLHADPHGQSVLADRFFNYIRTILSEE